MKGAVITEAVFTDLLMERLPTFWDRALKVFRDYGPGLSFEVTKVLLSAADREKEEEVLQELEKHWKEHLLFRHPETRADCDKTNLMFHRVWTRVSGLRPDQI